MCSSVRSSQGLNHHSSVDGSHGAISIVAPQATTSSSASGRKARSSERPLRWVMRTPRSTAS
jgi:hypothetical protein